ncbi:hypothetical protein CRUP_006751 [Coryphaenoides rupestris]|nr:hypothetical protein CRUP_006751 [Coryphaenoides rupestris]
MVLKRKKKDSFILNSQLPRHTTESQFAKRKLAQCVHSWVEYSSQSSLHRQNKGRAETYNRREQRLAREMAVLHHKHWCLQRDWGRWKRRFVQSQQEERRRLNQMRRHHEVKLLKHSIQAWKARKRQGTFLLQLKMYQKYFGVWQMQLGHRRQTVEQTAISLWHWSFGLQSKALYTWRLWVRDRRRKGERLARGVQFYRDQLLRRGVTHLLTHAALMSSLAEGQAQHSQQTSQGLHRTVRRCASRWKQQALCTQQGVPRDSQPQPKKKSMTFSCPTPALNPKEDVPCQVALKRILRLQPRQPKELLESPGPLGVSKPTNNQALLWHGLHGLEAPCGSYTTAPGEDVEVCSVKETADPATPLTTELLQIQVEMKHFQQDRKQLWAWQRLREVLRRWLETCGEEDDMERESVSLDLAGLEESINRLSEDLAKQKPAIVLHAARVQYLDAVLSGHTLHSRTPETL